MWRRGAQVPGGIRRALAGGAIAMLLVGACGSGTSPTPAPGGSAAGVLAAPARIREAGKVVWCTNLEYPPLESYAADGTTPEGLDIDIAAEIAKRWGVTSEVRATEWDALLPTLNGNGCDLVISGMTSTVPGRSAQADFVDYARTWTTFYVAPGNPRGIRSVEDLAGKSVAVAPGAKTEVDLRAASKELVAAGKPAIEIITTSKTDAEWAEQLGGGKVDALAGDSTEVVYHLGTPDYAGKVEIGGPTLNPEPVGIAVRKSDRGMKDAVAAVVDALSADGTLRSLVDEWGMTDGMGLLR